MPTALLIAYNFPPVQTVGGFRTMRFAKFLQEVGWKAVVLTVTLESVELPVDSALLDGLSADLLIRRAPAFSPSRLYRSTVAFFRRLAMRRAPFRKGDTLGAKPAAAGGPIQPTVSGEDSVATKPWRTRLFDTLFCTPDSEVWW